MTQTLMNIATGFLHVGDPFNLLVNLVGVFIGIIFGMMPGLSSTMALILFLPLTYGMELYPSFSLMIGLYIGSMSGSLISAILINIPGQVCSVATTWDGAPMARKGQARKALGVGIFYSFLATCFSIIIMMFIAPPLGQLALKFSAIEYFALGAFSLTLVAGLSGENIFKGLISCFLGMTLSMVGRDAIDIAERYTFGIKELRNGIPLTAFCIGLFAFAEIIRSSARRHNIVFEPAKLEKGKGWGFGFTMQEFKEQLPNFFRSSLIGVGIGVLPGFGGAVSNILAYNTEKKLSKHPEQFGTGCMAGVVASESSNNASIGGAMVPLLTMGIPGDGVTVILLGAFSMKGLAAGPMLFRTETDLVYGIYAAMVIATFMMLVVEFYGINIFVKLMNLPLSYILPVVAVFCMIGAYQDRNEMLDIWLCVAGGLMAWVMGKFDYPTTPMMLGYILGGTVENNLRRGLMLVQYDMGKFFSYPVANVIMGATVLYILFNLITSLRRRAQKRQQAKA